MLEFDHAATLKTYGNDFKAALRNIPQEVLRSELGLRDDR